MRCIVAIPMDFLSPTQQWNSRKKSIKFSTKSIGKAYITASKLCYFEKNYRGNMNTEDCNIKLGKGYVFNGLAGSGKTTWLCDMVMKAKNPLVLSSPNKSIENVKGGLNEMYMKKRKQFEIKMGLFKSKKKNDRISQ